MGVSLESETVPLVLDDDRGFLGFRFLFFFSVPSFTGAPSPPEAVASVVPSTVSFLGLSGSAFS